MMLLVGLGNPGKEYANTRHNIGFMAIDRIVDHYSFSAGKKAFKGIVSQGMIAGEKVYTIKPQTFMNRSGTSVSEIVRFYKIPLDNILVIHDELDVMPGKIKMKTGGGSGGHNGIKSIDQHIGAGYQRLRVGIGHPGDKERVSGYVLEKFRDEEWDVIDGLLTDISDQLSVWVKEGREAFLTKCALVRGETIKPVKRMSVIEKGNGEKE